MSNNETIGRTLGLLAVAIGVAAVAAYSLDWHSHVCSRCGRTWKHLGAFNAGDHDAHTCQSCGEIQWWKDIGKDGAFRASRRALEGSETATTETSKNWGELRRSRRIRSEER